MKTKDTLTTRLVILLTKLNRGDNLVLKELSDEFGVGIRTIQRDIEKLSYFMTIKKDDNHYSLESDDIDKLNLSDIENFATLSGIKELYPALDKEFLKKVLDKTIKEAYVVKGHNYEDISNNKKEFELLEEAVLLQNIVSFSYKNRPRNVQPYKLLNIKGIWYLAGVEHNTLKSFHILKMSELKKTNKTFEIDNKVLNEVMNQKDLWFGKKKEVILKVNEKVSEYFLRRDILPNQSIVKKLETGELLVSSKVSYDEEILKLVRYWIPNVSIVSPIELQEKLRGGLKKYLEDG